MNEKLLSLFLNWWVNVRVKPQPFTTVNMNTECRKAFEAGYEAADTRPLARWIEVRDCFPHMSNTWVQIDHKIDGLLAAHEGQA